MTVKYDKRDEYGNVEHVIANDEYGHIRGTTTVFDEEGVFPVKEINALLHETSLDYDRRFGVLKKETDPNGLITEWQYDSFGRETLEIRPDGSQTTTAVTRAKVNGVWRLSARTTATGGADDETIFDSLARPIRTFSYGPTPEGQEGKTPRLTRTQLDALGRPVTITDAKKGKIRYMQIPLDEAQRYSERLDTPDSKSERTENGAHQVRGYFRDTDAKRIGVRPIPPSTQAVWCARPHVQRLS